MSDDRAKPCCGPNETCPPAAPPIQFGRRDFLAFVGLGAGALMTGDLARRIAGPFPVELLQEAHPIPAEKNFDRAWVRSILERGERAVYRKSLNELSHIGMPIGGIGAGHVYLGGDGRLWHWDIFNRRPAGEWADSSGGHYAHPAARKSPMRQEFLVRFAPGEHMHLSDTAQTVPLDARGFAEILFSSAFPTATVEYRDPALPFTATLRAWSPFLPLDENDSSLPAIVMDYEIVNTGEGPLTLEIAGLLENIIGDGGGPATTLSRTIRPQIGERSAIAALGTVPLPAEAPRAEMREDLLFEDFESGRFDGWTIEGDAFGPTPVERARMPAYQGEIASGGKFLAHSHQTRNGEDVGAGDAHRGRLISKPFTIERDYITFKIDGGAHANKTAVRLLIGDRAVRSISGRNENRMHEAAFDVRRFANKTARIEIVDDVSGAWGNIGADDFVFTDRVPRAIEEKEPIEDLGTMTLALFVDRPETAFDAAPATDSVARVAALRRLAPRERLRARFVITWHFKGLLRRDLNFLADASRLERAYAARFPDADAVLGYVEKNRERLEKKTFRFAEVRTAGTLPHWFLDRTFLNISTLLTATCHLFSNGRFWAWEGTYCCAGTCTHVWQYAQAVARVFPGIERSTRAMIDFGAEFDDASGRINYRGEASRELAVDGQAGTILRAYREHLTSADGAFLTRIYPRVKKAIELLIARDPNEDGILDGAQYNTLDAAWYGKIAWISSLYLAALRAGEEMALFMRDDAFAARCRKIADAGKSSLVRECFDGEYFTHVPDPAHPETNSTGKGCHIDQLFGQSFAHQLGLGRIVPEKESLSALRSLWKYSFAPDIGPYRKVAEKTIHGGRWYAMPGEGGLLMCTWPKGGAESATGKGGDAWAAGYFNECMSGFEHQVASHMIAEGMVEEGFLITRTIHDRYHPQKRNPFNEVECSDHYARAMASFGSFITACGFTYDGPRGRIGFAPKLRPDDFGAFFLSAEGFGFFTQKRTASSFEATLTLEDGRLALNSIVLESPLPSAPRADLIRKDHPDSAIPLSSARSGASLTLTFSAPIVLDPETSLCVRIG